MHGDSPFRNAPRVLCAAHRSPDVINAPDGVIHAVFIGSNRHTAHHTRPSMTAVRARFALSHGDLCVSQGNIVAFRGDAIVNAADHKCICNRPTIQTSDQRFQKPQS